MSDQIQVTSEMQDRFALWFRENYPGPHTVIHDPDWHAPKIFRAALLSVQKSAQRPDAGGDLVSLADVCRFLEGTRYGGDYIAGLKQQMESRNAD